MNKEVIETEHWFAVQSYPFISVLSRRGKNRYRCLSHIEVPMASSRTALPLIDPQPLSYSARVMDVMTPSDASGHKHLGTPRISFLTGTNF